jgi:type IV pilus assembly protein PilW
MKPKKTNKCKHLYGFTLVELLVAMGITAVVMAAVYKIYTTQQDSYVLQEQVAEMQQNGRTAKYVMTREIRMAGYNPTRKLNVGNFVTSFVARLPGDGLADGDPNRTSTGSDSIAFTLDDNGDGVLDANFDEQIAYRVAGENLQKFDVDNDAWLTVVENIEDLGFAYAFDNDGDGSLDTDAGQVIWAVDNGGIWFDLDENDDGSITAADAPAGESTGIVVNLADIRAVKMWILARTGREDRAFVDTRTYVVGNQRVPANAGSRYHLLTTTVKCRNMAL